MTTAPDSLTHGGGYHASRRDPAPEIYRVALMFGICLLHSFEQGWHDVPPITKALRACVVGFVFISGWYGIRFRPSKLIRLYATAVACGALVFAAEAALGTVALAPTLACAKRLWVDLFGYWFLNAYALMMLLAPLVDAVLERVPPRLLPGILAPFLAATFLWAFARSAAPHELAWLIPSAEGLSANAGLTLLATYVVARLCRRLDVAARLTHRNLLLLLLPALAATLLFGNYTSPFSVAVAAGVFLLFLRVPWPDWLGRAASFLGPSMFAVYLLHTNRVGFDAIIRLEVTLIDDRGWNAWCVYPLVAALLFCATLLLDQPRRLIAHATRPLWAPLLNALDTRWAKRLPQA